MNGKPGDHPLTDIRNHGIEVYGEEADGLIQRIAELSSPRELEEWWKAEIGWRASSDEVLRKARLRHEELLERARKSGWEI